jgi:predicted small lipoprotein YifL
MNRPMNRHRSIRAMAAACAVISLAGCGGEPPAAGPPAEPPPELLLTFDENDAGPAKAPIVSNVGSARAQVDVVTVGQAAVSFTARQGHGSALVLPKYSGQKSGPFAAITVRAEGDWLSPGDRSFGFAADVRLNAETRGTAVDNGDNVLQRGLFEDPAQFKIQVDKRRPSCVIRGSAGTVVVKSKVVLGSGWYGLRCDRTGPDAVTLTVTDLDSGGALEVTSASGPLGDVAIAHGTPLSVGAKFGADGGLVVSSTDQFNGEIDNVSYSIDGGTS